MRLKVSSLGPRRESSRVDRVYKVVVSCRGRGRGWWCAGGAGGYVRVSGAGTSAAARRSAAPTSGADGAGDAASGDASSRLSWKHNNERELHFTLRTSAVEFAYS